MTLTTPLPTAWAHLPNAKHIDRVLVSLKEHPEKWKAARDAAWRQTAWSEACNAAYTAAQSTERIAARHASQNAAWGAARESVWGAGRSAIAALVAWDDCAYMLGLPEDALKVLRGVGNDQAILLSAAASVLNLLKETS